ncbi:MAG: glycosyltransferase [Gammaproteobacteria bacterium]|nr:glycosyltransferase [Gammaproteobacteria bacterium]
MGLWYVCVAFDPDTVARYRVTSAAPAAFNKVLGVAKALKESGLDVTIVSLSMARTLSGKVVVPHTRKYNSVEIKYCFAINRRIVKNIVASFTFLFCVIKNRKQFSSVIFYNHRPEYLFGMILCRLLGKKVIFDLEDGINKEDSRYHVILGKLLIKTYLYLAQYRLLTVSKKLAKETDHKLGVVCYGAVSKFADSARRFGDLKTTILFGGALYRDTGVPMFLQFIDYIARIDEIDQHLHIYVTGFGPFSLEIERKVANLEFVSFLGNITNEEYLEVLAKCQVAFVLKEPRSTIGQTTFPSKIVELSAQGLLIVTTPVSDIPELFSEEEVFIVETSVELEQTVLRIMSNREEAERMAMHSLAKARKLFGSRAVGDNIRKVFGL